jgi:hypothetical protein
VEGFIAAKAKLEELGFKVNQVRREQSDKG